MFSYSKLGFYDFPIVTLLILVYKPSFLINKTGLSFDIKLDLSWYQSKNKPKPKKTFQNRVSSLPNRRSNTFFSFKTSVLNSDNRNP